MKKSKRGGASPEPRPRPPSPPRPKEEVEKGIRVCLVEAEEFIGYGSFAPMVVVVRLILALPR